MGRDEVIYEVNLRLDPSIEDFFHHYPALELWNGSTVGAQRELLEDRIGIWMNLMNQGLATTMITDTDTHRFHSLRQGGGRTWTPSSTDDPAEIVDQEIGLAVKAGKAKYLYKLKKGQKGVVSFDVAPGTPSVQFFFQRKGAKKSATTIGTLRSCEVSTIER